MSRVSDESIGQLNARLRDNPADVAALAALKEKYRQARDYASLVNLLSGWATVAQSPQDRADALYEAGQVLLEACGAPDRAAPYFAQALAQDPGHEHAALGYQFALEQVGSYQELADFLAERCRLLHEQGGPAESQALLCYQVGELCKDRLALPGDALQWFLRAFELDGSIVRALYEARQIYLTQGDIAAAAGLLQQEAEAEPDAARRVLLLQELADVCEHDLQDMDAAVAALQGACLQAPENRELRTEYAQLLARAASGLPQMEADAYTERAAEVFTHLGLESAGEVRLSHLFAALKLEPGQHDALTALEADKANGTLEDADLAPLWVAYLQVKPEGPHHRQRRLALAQAYANSGQLDDAMFCLQAPQMAGMPEAEALLGELQPAARRAPPPVPTSESDKSLARDQQPVDEERTENARGRRPQDPEELPVSQVSPDKRPTKRPPPPASSAPDSHGVEPTSAAPPPLPNFDLEAAPQIDSEASAPQPVPKTSPSAERPAPEAPHDAADGEGPSARVARTPAIAAPSTSAIPAATAEEFAQLKQALQDAIRNRQVADGVASAERILATELTDKDAFNYLDTYLRKTRDHRARCALLERTAGAEALANETRILRLRESAGLRESRLKEIDGAISLWKQVADLDPESDEPTRNLKRLGDRIKRWESLELSLEQELGGADDEGHRREILRRLCTLHTEQRANPEAAASALRRLLQIAEDPEAEARLEETLVLLGDFPEATMMMRRRADTAATTAERVGALLQLAHITRDKLGDLPAAYRVFEEALPLVERPTDVLLALADIDDALDRHAQLLNVLSRLRRLQTGDAAIATTLRMAEVANARLSDLERAVDILSSAADSHPQHESLTAALFDTLQRAGRYDDLVEALREQSVLEKDRRRRSSLMRRTAQVLEEHLHDEAGAVAVMESLLREEEDPEALRYLEDRARRNDDLSTLVELLERRLQVSQGTPDEYAIRMERAKLLIQDLGRPADAVEDLAHVLDRVNPGDADALLLLEPACQAAGRFDVLARALERKLSADENGPEDAGFAHRLADLYEVELPSRRKSIAALKRWAALDASDAEPHRRLRPLLHAQRDQQSLLHTLDLLSELEGGLDERIEATISAAQLCAGALNDPEGAWTRLLTPASQGIESAISALQQLAERLGRMDEYCDFLQNTELHARLFSVLDGLIERAPENAERAHWLRRSAQAHLECVDDRPGAESKYARLLSLQEDQEALQFVLGRARERKEPAAVAEYLGRLADQATDAAARVALRSEQAALLMDALGRPAEAAHCYRAILTESGHSEPAEQGLIAALRDAHMYSELVERLEALLERTTLAQDRVPLAQEIAEIYRDPLERPEAALPALRIWHAADPVARAPLRALDGLLEGAEHRDERLQVLDLLVEFEDTDQDKARASLAAARLLRLEKQEPEGALERLSPFVRLASPEVDSELTAIADLNDDLFERVSALFDSSSRDDAYVQLLERRLDKQPNGDKALELHRRAARLLTAGLDLPAEAERHYRAILEQVEDEEALRFQRAQAMQADDPRALTDCLGRLAAVASDVTARNALRFEQAHILRVRLGEPARAADILRKVVAETPDFAAALDELSVASEDAGDTEGLVDSLERALRIEENPQQRADLGERLFTVCRDDLKDERRGMTGLLAFQQARPDAPEPLRHLRDLYVAQEESEKLLWVLDRLAQVEPNARSRTKAQLEAGKLAATPALADLDGAFERLWPLAQAEEAEGAAARALMEIARKGGALQRLGQLYEQAERFEELARLLQEQAEDATDPETRADLYQRCAETFAGPLGDEIAATEAFRELVAVREDLPALRYLADGARRFEATETLEPLLGRIAAQTDDEQERVAVLMEQARLLYDALGETAKAIETLRRLIAESPHAEEAVEELITICEAERHFDGLAEGLWAQVTQEQDRLSRVETAKRLVELHEAEGALPDGERLVAALEAWLAADPSDAEPYAELIPLLDPERDAERLIYALDVIARRGADLRERSQAACRAAQLVQETHNDTDGAIARLATLFGDRHEKAEALLARLCLENDRASSLAALYVNRAKSAAAPAQTAADWAAAAELYEQPLGQAKEALEASLRRLAVDTASEPALAAVERLALQQSAAGRLTRVYAKLVDARRDDSDKIALCLRASEFFGRAGETQNALDWALMACRVDPDNTAAAERAQTLADSSGSHGERMWLCEQRARRAETLEERIRCMLQAATIADGGLQDREQANQILATALTMAQDEAALCDEIFIAASTIDALSGDGTRKDATRVLLQEQLRIAGQADGRAAELAYLQTARRMVADLADQAAAYDALKRATVVMPESERLLNALEQSASDLGRLDGLDAHLARLLDQQQDATVKAALLTRRGQLLSDRLERFDSAARVYGTLLDLLPGDPQATALLDDSLRRAGRFQELVRALDRRIKETEDSERKAALLCGQARVWEHDLRNKMRALSTYQQVVMLDPTRREAVEGIERLSVSAG